MINKINLILKKLRIYKTKKKEKDTKDEWCINATVANNYLK